MKTLITKSIGFYLNTLHIVMPELAARQGFTIFCNPLRSKLQDHHKQFLELNKNFTLDIDGVKVQTYKWGNGEKKILFLHGWSSHSFRWKNYIEKLSGDNYTIYAFDAPGHGLSEGNFLHVPLYAKTVKHFLDNVGKVHHVVSHSIGSFTALYAFHLHPELMPEKIVLLAPPGEAEDFFTFYTKTLSLNSKTTHSIRNYFEKKVGHPPAYFSASNFASHISAKGLIIHDENDQDTDVLNSKNIHAAWPNSELMITKELGHHLKDNRIYDTVIRFIHEPVFENLITN
ncbi:MAG: alpha/beta hydrolase [Chitinophagaceae bacterium]|jgi:pimeloyl-ACP methyl ester carboxylesterase|nr:alpha/beta hydrolase [Chitinophagaceae bacterium]MCU0384086.1 alpha/beta hydrolase [Cyclobacteriaceae bacterium]